MDDGNNDPLADVNFGTPGASQAAPATAVAPAAHTASNDDPLAGVDFSPSGVSRIENNANAPMTWWQAAKDYARSFSSGLEQGAVSAAGLPGTLAEAGQWVAHKAGYPDVGTAPLEGYGDAQKQGLVTNVAGYPIPTMAGIRHVASEYLPGAGYEPQTAGGRWANAAGTGIGGALPAVLTGGASELASGASLADAASGAGSSLVGGLRAGLGAQAGYSGAKAFGLNDTAAGIAGLVGGVGGNLGRPLGTAKSAAAAPEAEAADVGRALLDRALPMKQNVNAAYDYVRTLPGYFTGNALGPIYGAAVNGVESTKGFPGWGELGSYGMYKPVNDALATMHSALSRWGGSPDGANMQNLDTLRKALLREAYDHPNANTDATRYVKGMIAGLDQGIEGAAADPRMFTGGNGQAIVQAQRTARAAHAAYENNFGSSAPDPVQAAMENLPVDGSPVSYGKLHNAGVELGNGIKQYGPGSALHEHLAATGVDMAPVNSYAQQLLLAGGKQKVAQNLSAPAAQNILGPDFAAAQRMNAQRGELPLWKKMTPTFARMAGAGAGAHLAGPWGAVAGEHVAGNIADRITGRGVPASIHESLQNPAPALAQRAGNAAVNVAKFGLPAGAVVSGQEPDTQHPQYARGGKVGYQHLVGRLMRAVEKARKAEQHRTSAILQQPDERVAKALNVAQEAI